MIPELAWLAALFLVCAILMLFMREKATLADYSERAHVNRLADQSKKRSAPGMRPRCRYIQAGVRGNER